MKEQIAQLLNDYAHRRGGGPVNLTNHEVAADLAEFIADSLPQSDPHEDR